MGLFDRFKKKDENSQKFSEELLKRFEEGEEFNLVSNKNFATGELVQIVEFKESRLFAVFMDTDNQYAFVGDLSTGFMQDVSYGIVPDRLDWKPEDELDKDLQSFTGLEGKIPNFNWNAYAKRTERRVSCLAHPSDEFAIMELKDDVFRLVNAEDDEIDEDLEFLFKRNGLLYLVTTKSELPPMLRSSLVLAETNDVLTQNIKKLLDPISVEIGGYSYSVFGDKTKVVVVDVPKIEEGGEEDKENTV